jgi:O-methyltransferase
VTAIGAAKARVLQRLERAIGFEFRRIGALPHDVDPETAATIRAVRPYTMTSTQRLVALCDAVRYLVQARIKGDIVECGVWRGGSMMAVARTLLQQGDGGRDLHLFDTFEGMTEPGEADISLEGESAVELLRTSSRSDPASVWCYAPLDEVRVAMGSTGYDPAKTRFVQGRVEDTLPRHAPERIALLRLDTDWYESTRHTLEQLYPRLAVGGVLILDDYGHWQGARRAVDEYIAGNELALYLHRIDYSGRCAIKTGN